MASRPVLSSSCSNNSAKHGADFLPTFPKAPKEHQACSSNADSVLLHLKSLQITW